MIFTNKRDSHLFVIFFNRQEEKVAVITPVLALTVVKQQKIVKDIVVA